MRNVQPRRRRRRAGIASIIGGAIAAVLLNWFGFGPAAKPEAVRTPTNASSSAHKHGDPAATPELNQAHFDFYTLALSLAPAFCETAPNKKQCDKLSESVNTTTPLTLHGLWPENARAGSYPESCAGQAISVRALERQIDARRLRQFMPGIVDGLASHEWRKHGTCTGLSPESYFAAAITWTERINTALLSTLKSASGKLIIATQLKAAAERALPGLGQALTLHCRNIKTHDANMLGKPVLLELHVCLQKDADGLPSALIECASLDRIDQGCGTQFLVDRI